MPERLTKDDKLQIVDKICSTLEERRTKRGDLEKQWDEIDRQLEMTPADNVVKTRVNEL